MFNQLLRCTHCHDDFEGLEEFSVCPNCKIGFLIEGSFDSVTGEGALDAAINSFGIKKQDYEEAGLEMPEHPNCRCYIMPVNSRIEFSPLSFDDMELNEICLIDLGLPSRHPTSLEDPVPAISYYSEMNTRFLHTFLETPGLAEIA